MSETTSEIILDEKQFWTLEGMLNSSPDDQKLAFMCINKLDPAKNVVPVLLLRKFSNTNPSDWMACALKHIQYHKSIHVSGMVRYDDITRLLNEGNRKLNEKLIMLKMQHTIRSMLGTTLKNVEDIELKIKFKDE